MGARVPLQIPIQLIDHVVLILTPTLAHTKNRFANEFDVRDFFGLSELQFHGCE